MTPRESETHDIAFLRQDNGELEEDGVHREVTGGPPSGGAGPSRGGRDRQSAAGGAHALPAPHTPS